MDKLLDWAERNAGKAIAIYLIGAVVLWATIGLVIYHFIRKFW